MTPKKTQSHHASKPNKNRKKRKHHRPVGSNRTRVRNPARESGWPRSELKLCYSLAVWVEVSPLFSLSLSSLTESWVNQGQQRRSRKWDRLAGAPTLDGRMTITQVLILSEIHGTLVLEAGSLVNVFKIWKLGASLVAQWLRIHLPMQGTWVRALVRQDPTCRGATGPMRHNLLSLRSRACEPQLLSPCATTTEAHAPRAHALQQEKPPQWEACAPQRRVAPARH